MNGTAAAIAAIEAITTALRLYEQYNAGAFDEAAYRQALQDVTARGIAAFEALTPDSLNGGDGAG